MAEVDGADPDYVGPKGEKPKDVPLFEYGFGLSYR